MCRRKKKWQRGGYGADKGRQNQMHPPFCSFFGGPFNFIRSSLTKDQQYPAWLLQNLQYSAAATFLLPSNAPCFFLLLLFFTFSPLVYIWRVFPSRQCQLQ
uniref:Uncharacterized protein n=1 Tax=Trypanosoma congolense (strain IL3000) TaxID=1068625 RepID=G0UTG1_TRYCI|nr:hypothetical protein, unlikely [Trypanosoma congolense IL3000]